MARKKVEVKKEEKTEEKAVKAEEKKKDKAEEFPKIELGFDLFSPTETSEKIGEIDDTEHIEKETGKIVKGVEEKKKKKAEENKTEVIIEKKKKEDDILLNIF